MGGRKAAASARHVVRVVTTWLMYGDCLRVSMDGSFAPPTSATVCTAAASESLRLVHLSY